MVVQAHVSQLALKQVLAALAQHPNDIDIQAKGMVVLGVLGQVCYGMHCMLASSEGPNHKIMSVCKNESG